MYNPKMNSDFIAEVGAKWNFCRSYIIRYEVILQEKLSYFSLLKTIKNDLNFRRIYEDNRSLPNAADQKFKFKIFNLGVDFI